ncbi:hemerythrin domain-containing protein [Actinomadura logoneensis]|uniref:Hemerythrin domain-containing protein n=1 Tax=Actinomadura logoneensis TaxID=2293572 RepID=A0A372JTM2_9ACTN|nr:hemerythrin domain-containing protein [Actinomadura logoneensis]RFU43373.1 hemerythrin domain-containing protein [Actinomadura logoneensis]
MAEQVVELLLRQHEEIRRLFAEVERTSGKEREEAFGRLRHLLAVHETAEEEIVHPFARRELRDGEKVVDARLKEENEAKGVLERLEKTGVDDPEFDALFSRLRKEVEEHARHEESDEFPHLAAAASAEQLRGMATAVRAAEAVAPTHPHQGVESATKNMVLGPMAAVADRARDAIRKARG